MISTQELVRACTRTNREDRDRPPVGRKTLSAQFPYGPLRLTPCQVPRTRRNSPQPQGLLEFSSCSRLHAVWLRSRAFHDFGRRRDPKSASWRALSPAEPFPARLDAQPRSCPLRSRSVRPLRQQPFAPPSVSISRLDPALLAIGARTRPPLQTPSAKIPIQLPEFSESFLVPGAPAWVRSPRRSAATFLAPPQPYFRPPSTALPSPCHANRPNLAPRFSIVYGTPDRTADRNWVYARAWLRCEMDREHSIEKTENSPDAGDAFWSH